MPLIGPESKEDIIWIPFNCDECGTVTNVLDGDEPRCAKCSLDKAIAKKVTNTMTNDEYIPSLNNLQFPLELNSESLKKEQREGAYCLQDCISTSDPHTLAKVKSECADLGCNVCLSETSFDDIEWPKHYNTGKFQPIDVIEDWKLDFRLANAVKYIARQGKKDPNRAKKDLQKAIWYIKRFIDKELN